MKQKSISKLLLFLLLWLIVLITSTTLASYSSFMIFKKEDTTEEIIKKEIINGINSDTTIGEYLFNQHSSLFGNWIDSNINSVLIDGLESKVSDEVQTFYSNNQLVINMYDNKQHYMTVSDNLVIKDSIIVGPIMIDDDNINISIENSIVLGLEFSSAKDKNYNVYITNSLVYGELGEGTFNLQPPTIDGYVFNSIIGEVFSRDIPTGNDIKLQTDLKGKKVKSFKNLVAISTILDTDNIIRNKEEWS